MKAKQYFEMLQRHIEEGATDKEAVTAVFIAMAQEVKTICVTRHVQFDRGVISAIGEMNDRWNAMCKMDPTLVRDGFKTLMMKTILDDNTKPQAPAPSKTS